MGIRPGEKLHETLISEDESRMVKDIGDHYVILPSFVFSIDRFEKYSQYKSLPEEGFLYRSDINKEWLTIEELKQII